MTKYLFYNPDTRPIIIQNLIDTKPSDVEVFKWGWSPALETARENQLNELGINCPGLPCVVYNRQAYTTTVGEFEVPKPQGWFPLTLPENDTSLWNWTWINEQITDEVD
jgi:hypothetical protein